jgi:hypothetical protein
MRHRSVLVAATAVFASAALAVNGAGASAADPSSVPASGVHVSTDAAHGGRVIVVLKQQYSSLRANRSGGAARTSATQSSQAGIVADIKAHGGTDVQRLVSVNAVAANLSGAEVARLRVNPAVSVIQRDLPVVARAVPESVAPNISRQVCPSDPKQPLLEPEALTDTHFESQPAQPTDADQIATGKGVIVGLTNINTLAGNPNLIRPDGEHVVINSPTPNEDDDNTDGGGDEWYGDASAIAGQGTVTYDFANELPGSGLPEGCTFVIKGISPDVSLVDTGYFGQGPGSSTAPAFESQAIAGLDNAAIEGGAQVISESYGYGAIPGQIDFSAITIANDQLVAAGITVVESAGDSGSGGTVEVPAYDPLVIDAGASTTLRLLAQAWGYTGWDDDNIAALSSGGTTPSNNTIDLVAPGLGGEASCSQASATCPSTTLTEAFGGTSQSAPFIAGAAADVIQAYSDSHGGTPPTPALVKQILTGTATDLDAPSDNQGAGLLNVEAAVLAAQQMPGSTVSNSSASVLPSPTQLNVSGAGGTTSNQTISLYNASSTSAKFSGTFRTTSAPTQIGLTTTEPVTAPASGPYPSEGADAADLVNQNVPAGLSQLKVDMITPNPTNDAVLSLLLFDPDNNLAQVSYDYSSGANGPVSNNEEVTVNDPEPGIWTAKIVWNNGRAHLQNPPPTPGTYRGNISVRFMGQHTTSARAFPAVTIAAHQSATVTVPVRLPVASGDSPVSLDIVSTNGAATSVPVTRRTMVPTAGGPLSFTLGSSVARGTGPLQSRTIDVPAGLKDLRIQFSVPDTSADNIVDFFAVEPDGLDGYYDRAASTTPSSSEAKPRVGHAAITVADPTPGLWTIQAMIDLTESGMEFTQTVTGSVSYNVGVTSAITAPDSAATDITEGQTQPVSVMVKNTTGVGRTFQLLSTNGDVTGPSVYIGSGTTKKVTGTVTAPSNPGVVSGQIFVVSNGSALSPLLDSQGYFFDLQSEAAFPYEYTDVAP